MCALVASMVQRLVGPTARIATLVDINRLQQRRHASIAQQGSTVPLARPCVGNAMQDSISRKRRKPHAPGAPLASSLRRPEVLAVICAKRGGLQQAKGRANAWAATPDPRQAAVLLTARRAVQVTFAQPELRWMSLAKKWSKLRGNCSLMASLRITS